MNTLDDNDHALHEANAELARRRAIQRGDMGSPLLPHEPVSFVLHRCEHCDCELTAHARSHIIGVCQRCLEELVALREWKDKQLAKEASRTGWLALGTIIPWLLMAFAAAAGLAWLWDKLAWAVGRGTP